MIMFHNANFPDGLLCFIIFVWKTNRAGTLLWLCDWLGGLAVLVVLRNQKSEKYFFFKEKKIPLKALFNVLLSI